MILLEKIDQYRRDFTGIYKCESESCDNKEKYEGCYDDRNFHDNVIPDQKCSKCNKSSKDLGTPPRLEKTKYSEGEVV